MRAAQTYFVPPWMTHRLHEEYVMKENGSESHKYHSIVTILKRLFARHEQLLISFYDGSTQRCAFLSVWKETREVRRYEGGYPEDLFTPRMQHVVSLLDVDMKLELPLSHACYNAFHGTALTLHYIEAEVREFAGETRGLLGWPSLDRLKAVEKKLKQLRSCIDVVRSKLNAQEEKENAQREELEQKYEDRARKEVRDVMARKEKLLRAKAEAILSHGVYKGPLGPWGVKLDPVSKKPKKMQAEAQAQVEMSFFSEASDKAAVEGADAGAAPPEAPEAPEQAEQFAAEAKDAPHAPAEASDEAVVEGADAGAAPPEAPEAPEQAEQFAAEAKEAPGANEALEVDDIYGEAAPEAPEALAQDAPDAAAEADEQGAVAGAAPPEASEAPEQGPHAAALALSEAEQLVLKANEGGVLSTMKYRALEDQYVLHVLRNEFSAEHRDKLEKVEQYGLGICSRCELRLLF